MSAVDFLHTYAKELVSLCVPIVTWALNRFLKGKARLRIAQPHGFTFLVQEPLRAPDGTVIKATQTVQTRSFMIQNDGREPATKLELVFNWKPMCHNIWPSRHVTEHLESDGRFVLIFESLSPGEAVGCEVLAVNADIPQLITARSNQAVGQKINMYPQPVVSRGYRVALGALVLLGLAAAIYLSILLVQFLVLKTPIGH
jgi:hypothetical protein